ncbi:MAG: class III signal peptide-containing protein [Candidatus Diapherotrites archaeon]|nr:class III signal peptide-containing protein [Candidatus Diapherotrites archaeon]
MDSKGQSALEYILLIGGAVLIAAIVVAFLVSQSTSSTDTIKDTTNSNQSVLDKIENEAFNN